MGTSFSAILQAAQKTPWFRSPSWRRDTQLANRVRSAGAIAKALLPGRIGGGWLSTLVLGLVGAFVGGIIADVVFHTGAYSLLPRIGWATTGAVVVLAVKGWLSSRPSS